MKIGNLHLYMFKQLMLIELTLIIVYKRGLGFFPLHRLLSSEFTEKKRYTKCFRKFKSNFKK